MIFRDQPLDIDKVLENYEEKIQQELAWQREYTITHLANMIDQSKARILDRLKDYPELLEKQDR